ncbi:MAG: FAD-dependent oxidoreductase, partial [Armatimonadota bacterium]
SCRLSRTMMQLGQAAGTAAALAVGRGVDARDLPAEYLRDALRAQHVQLEWPMPNGLREALASRQTTL